MKIWKTVAFDPAGASRLANAMGLPLPLAEVISGMGLSRPDEIDRFLNPRLSDLSDPFLLPDMEVAVRRIWRAIAGGESIAVYGDYDVDGITSACLLLKVLNRLGADRVTPCLPSRLTEGYGLSVEALERCIEKAQPRLIVTVDCGTNAVAAVRAASASGIEVIVTDHHEVAGELAPAAALVNPKRGGHEGLKALAGVGVVFKLCHALVKFGRAEGRAAAAELDLREHLDLVAIGTVTDIVPLLGENRILVRHGLPRLNQTPSAGWRALMDIAGFRNGIDTWQIAFGLGPRLNAVGRLGSAESALELLLTDDAARARELAGELDAANRDRQQIESAIMRAAVEEIDASFDATRHFGIVIGREGWHPGVIGIVASRLAARYRRPVVIVAFDADGVGRGSARSIENFHLLRGLEQCSGHLSAYGGHELAAGIEIQRDRLPAFREQFNAVVAAALQDQDLRPVQRINAWLNLEQADDRLLAGLDQLRPFGQCNPTPVLAVRGARVEGTPRVVGKKHLRLTLAADGVQRPAIAFGMADREIPAGPLDVAFHLQRDTFMGGEALQLNVQDIRAAE